MGNQKAFQIVLRKRYSLSCELKVWLLDRKTMRMNEFKNRLNLLILGNYLRYYLKLNCLIRLLPFKFFFYINHKILNQKL